LRLDDAGDDAGKSELLLALRLEGLAVPSALDFSLTTRRFTGFETLNSPGFFPPACFEDKGIISDPLPLAVKSIESLVVLNFRF
jgi:hypothetical protein